MGCIVINYMAIRKVCLSSRVSLTRFKWLVDYCNRKNTTILISFGHVLFCAVLKIEEKRSKQYETSFCQMTCWGSRSIALAAEHFKSKKL